MLAFEVPRRVHNNVGAGPEKAYLFSINVPNLMVDLRSLEVRFDGRTSVQIKGVRLLWIVPNRQGHLGLIGRVCGESMILD
jgi:hypothetical protein